MLEEINKVIKERSVNVSELARVVDLPQPSLWRRLNGEVKMDELTERRIKEYLEI